MSGHLIDNLLLALAGIGVEVFLRFRLTRFFRVLLSFGLLGESCRLQLHDALYLPGAEAFALGLEALDGNELFGVNFLAASELVGTAIGHLDERIDHIGEQHHLRQRVLA